MATPNSTTTTSARSNSNPDFIFPKGRGFKMASLNITSLLKHIDELRIVLDGQPIDILAINETTGVYLIKMLKLWVMMSSVVTGPLR